MPPHVAEDVARVAARDGISENAALIALAELGAVVDARNDERRARRAAALQALDSLGGEMPLPADYDAERTADELEALVTDSPTGS